MSAQSFPKSAIYRFIHFNYLWLSLQARLNASFNRHLARENSNRKVADKIAEEKDNLAEIYNCLSSDMLTENPETAKSNFGVNRKIPYMYRGMSAGEVEAYRHAQLRQQEKAIEKLHAEKEESNKWYNQMMGTFRTQELKQRECERTKVRAEKEVLDSNKCLAGQQQSAQKEINHQLDNNQPTNEYFNQFNTTSRWKLSSKHFITFIVSHLLYLSYYHKQIYY